MKSLFRLGIALAALMVLPHGFVYAQEASVSGTITDSTGGVLPGVTVTVVHEPTGNNFLAVTDGRGMFRLPVRTGPHRVRAELGGFATVERTIELLVGQTAVISLPMVPATVRESVTVTGQAPLIDVTSSTLGSNIDPRQMQALPVNGRNWLDLTMLAAGARQNTSSDNLGMSGASGNIQLNMDGLRVTQQMATGFGQPRYGRDTIAEFELITNRFDASQGYSTGVLVNAITKSGTNQFAGTFSGYFRDDRFIAKDFVTRRVLPYSNQQLAVTFGGPIRKDRVHFFGNFEHEREPATFTHNSAFSGFNLDLTGTRTDRKGGGRVDIQFSPQTRLMTRGNRYVEKVPYDPQFTGGATRHPSTAMTRRKESLDVSGTLTQVLGTRAVNEVVWGYAGYSWLYDPVVRWANHPWGLEFGSPIIFLRGYQIGQGHTNSRQKPEQDAFSIRDTFIRTFDGGGRHTLKMGGEYIRTQYDVLVCNRCMGVIDAAGGAIPANIEQLFPVWNDVSTWNLAGLSPITRFYQLGIGGMHTNFLVHNGAGWIQDDWSIASRLTLNLGLRYDVQRGSNAEDLIYEPFLTRKRPTDKDNFAPRIGFAYAMTKRTVLRGGFGRFYGDTGSNTALWANFTPNQVVAFVPNDGRVDFAANPFNGPIPTFEQARGLTCRVNPARSGCLRQTILIMANPDAELPYAYQGSIGVQRQLGAAMAIEADYVYNGQRAQTTTPNVNIAYNVATGANYPFSNVAARPFPAFDSVGMRLHDGESDDHSLQVALTKRFSNRWQAQAAYALAARWDHQRPPIYPGCQHPWTASASGQVVCNQPITLAPDLRDEWYLTGDQRHRFVANGIWDIGYGLQVSGLYFYGEQGRLTPTSGVDVRQAGVAAGGRLRPNGTLIERNSFDAPSLHRVDMRLQRRFTLGHRTVDGVLEVFNLFNRENFGSYVTNEASPAFGRPTFNNNVAFTARLLQLGFRVAF